MLEIKYCNGEICNGHLENKHRNVNLKAEKVQKTIHKCAINSRTSGRQFK